jgi:hypothetical protein
MISMGIIRELTTRKHKEHCQSTTGQTQAKGLLKRPSAKGAEELLCLSHKPAKNIDVAVSRTLSLKWTPIQAGVGRQSQLWQMQTGI